MARCPEPMLRSENEYETKGTSISGQSSVMHLIRQVPMVLTCFHAQVLRFLDLVTSVQPTSHRIAKCIKYLQHLESHAHGAPKYIYIPVQCSLCLPKPPMLRVSMVLSLLLLSSPNLLSCRSSNPLYGLAIISSLVREHSSQEQTPSRNRL